MKKKLFIYFIVIVVLNLTFGFLIKEYVTSISYIEDFVKIIYKLFLAFIVLLLIVKYKLLPKKIFSKQNIIIIPLIGVSIYLSQKKISNYAILNNIVLDEIEHLLFFLTCLSVGLFEEILFRVFIFRYSIKYSFFKGTYKSRIIKSIAFTSILFGAIHFVNLLNPNYDTISVCNQVLMAISLGILLQSIYYRFNSVLLIVFIHTIFNYLGSFKPLLLNTTQRTEVLTIDDFYSTAIFIVLLTVLLVLPLSAILIRKKLAKEVD
jgi:membrane protease YdiL (CAAX protease family)